MVGTERDAHVARSDNITDELISDIGEKRSGGLKSPQHPIHVPTPYTNGHESVAPDFVAAIFLPCKRRGTTNGRWRGLCAIPPR